MRDNFRSTYDKSESRKKDNRFEKAHDKNEGEEIQCQDCIGFDHIHKDCELHTKWEQVVKFDIKLDTSIL